MRAGTIIQREFEADLRAVHLARVRVVFATVWTLLRTGRLSLTSLGRAIAERTSPKHGIKRIDRLLWNARLQQERLAFYRAIARRLIRPGSRPVVLVDWTSVTPELWALVAAVCFEGRALVIYSEAHPITRYLKPYVNLAFLYQLEAVLPAGCAPIIVTDAGFRSPWMKLVESFNWDFVGRLRAPAKVRRDRSEAFVHIENFWHLARSVPKELGVFQIGHRRRYPVRVVAVRKKRRAYPIPVGRDHGDDRHRRNAHEPWMLATSLDWPAAKVAAIYRCRMQIEETFRDAKSTRYGMALSHARTKSDHRANVLLMLAALAHVVLVLVGVAAEAARLNLRYQANTLQSRRVLSVAMLGKIMLERGDDGLLASALSAASWAALILRMDGALAW
jgi:hypothetical protein